MKFDFYLTEKIIQLSLRYEWLDTLAIFFAEYIDYLFVFLVFLLLFWNFRATFLGAFAIIFSRILVIAPLRFFIERGRPLFFFEDTLGLVRKANSFPSGHAAFYFAFATIIYLYNKKIGIFFFILSSLMSLARVFIAYHWVVDVLTGALIGIITGCLIWEVVKRGKITGYFSSIDKILNKIDFFY